jgi:hypothetical protein
VLLLVKKGVDWQHFIPQSQGHCFRSALDFVFGGTNSRCIVVCFVGLSVGGLELQILGMCVACKLA